VDSIVGVYVDTQWTQRDLHCESYIGVPKTLHCRTAVEQSYTYSFCLTSFISSNDNITEQTLGIRDRMTGVSDSKENIQ
jgi:hypothetical protein